MWGNEKDLELLGKAEFQDIRIHQLEHDIQNDYYVILKQQKAGHIAGPTFSGLGSFDYLVETVEPKPVIHISTAIFR